MMSGCDTASVLLTSSGSLVVRAVIASLADRRGRLRLIGVNSEPDVSYSGHLDRFHRMPLTASPDFAVALEQVLSRESPHVIIPGRDDDVLALTALAESGAFDPGRLVAGPHDGAVALRDTGRCAEFARAHGLPFVTTVRTGLAHSSDDVDLLVRGTPGPWVIKPSSGQGSRDVLVTWSSSELASHATWPGHVIQPFVGEVSVQGHDSPTVSLAALGPRDDIDLQVVLGTAGDLLGVSAFTSRMVDGKVTAVDVLRDASALSCAEAYARVLSHAGWRGPVNIQAARRLDGSIEPFEVNPRFSGGTWMRRQAGFDEVGMILRSFLGTGIFED